MFWRKENMSLVGTSKKTKFGETIVQLETSVINAILSLRKDFDTYSAMITDATSDIDFTDAEVEEIQTSMDNSHRLLRDAAVDGIPVRLWEEIGITIPESDTS
jgi:hypothetical protein